MNFVHDESGNNSNEILNSICALLYTIIEVRNQPKEQRKVTKMRKEIVYANMVEAAKQLKFSQIVYQNYLDRKDIEGALNYLKTYLNEGHEAWRAARDDVRKLYKDDKQYMEVLRDACNEGEQKGVEMYKKMNG